MLTWELEMHASRFRHGKNGWLADWLKAEKERGGSISSASAVFRLAANIGRQPKQVSDTCIRVECWL